MLGDLGNHSGHRWRRAITLAGPLLTTLCAHVLQVIALNSRYLLRVSTTEHLTYFEYFTRRGQFIGEYTLNLRLTQVAPTAHPYQLIALSAPTHQSPAAVFLITLKPFQIRRIHLPILPEQVSAFPWGYLISYKQKALLLDRLAQIAGSVTGLPAGSAMSGANGPAIASLSHQKILLATARASTAVSSTVQNAHQNTETERILSLLVADISALDLGIIF